MAASVAPVTGETTEASSSSTRTAIETVTAAFVTTTDIQPKDKSSSNNTHQHHQSKFNTPEVCRSCGKSCEDLYDLFQTASTTTNVSLSQLSHEESLATPFTTSSTTCYSNTTTTTNTTPASTTSDAVMNESASTNVAASTFDSVAATAKATAKGQSNMENILQEMQIWHLQVSDTHT